MPRRRPGPVRSIASTALAIVLAIAALIGASPSIGEASAASPPTSSADASRSAAAWHPTSAPHLAAVAHPAAAHSAHGRHTARRQLALPPGFDAPAVWSDLCDSVGPRDTPLVRGMNCRYLQLDGVYRRWIVSVPRDTDLPMNRAWPVVVVIHGSGKSGEEMLRRTNWPAVAKRQGVIAVYPTAWRYHRVRTNTDVERWNTWQLPSEIAMGIRLDGYPATSPYPARDITFLTMVMDDLRGELTLDRRRIHAAGSSQGGRFIPRMAVEMAGTFASMSCWGFCDAPDPEIAVPRRLSILYGVGTVDPLLIDVLRRDHPGLQRLPTAWGQVWPLLQPLIAEHLRAWTIPDDPPRVRRAPYGLAAQWVGPGRLLAPGIRFGLMIVAGADHKPPTPWSNPRGTDFAAASWAFFAATPRAGTGP